MSTPAVNLNLLSAALAGLSGADLQKVKQEINATLNSLHSDYLEALIATPPEDTTELENEYDLANAWLRALNSATGPAAGATAQTTLLNAMRAVDTHAAASAALNGLVVAVNGLVASFPS